jgi:hypothetical protein
VALTQAVADEPNQERLACAVTYGADLLRWPIDDANDTEARTEGDFPDDLGIG